MGRIKICEHCALTDTCRNYQGIKDQPELEITECDDLVRIINHPSCIECKHSDIFESSNEWLSCRCAAYGDVKDGGLYNNNCSRFECVEGVVLREGN